MSLQDTVDTLTPLSELNLNSTSIGLERIRRLGEMKEEEEVSRLKKLDDAKCEDDPLTLSESLELLEVLLEMDFNWLASLKKVYGLVSKTKRMQELFSRENPSSSRVRIVLAEILKRNKAQIVDYVVKQCLTKVERHTLAVYVKEVT